MSEGEQLLRQEDLDALFQSAATPSGTRPETSSNPSAIDDPGLTVGAIGAGGFVKSPTTPGPGGNPPFPAISDAEDAGRLLRQAEIDKLLEQAGLSRPKKSPVVQRGSPPPASEDSISARDIEYLLEQAEQALRSVEEPASGSELPPGVKPFEFEQFGPTPSSVEAASLDLISEVELEVRIELGQARMYLEDVLKLRKGSVVTLDKLAGDPVDIYVNGRLIARGEVLVLNDNFCVRVIELVAPK
jgi:flagellar motor switch protein FliN/FliY